MRVSKSIQFQVIPAKPIFEMILFSEYTAIIQKQEN